MSTYPYSFNNMGRISSDMTDQTQKNVYNTRFANHTLSNFFGEMTSDSHVKFALQQPTMALHDATLGPGINGAVVDDESLLYLGIEQERAFERVQLMQRPFLTVPYLGRGSCDPIIESQLQQGEHVSDKKSVSTIMEQSFSNYALNPTDEKMDERVKNPAFVVQEAALEGWTRGGVSSK